MVWSKNAFVALTALAAAQTVYYYPLLPDVVASHFDGLGAANGWADKNVFFGLYLAMVLLVIGVFTLLPRWAASRVDAKIRIPDPDYWLAPERIDATRLFLRRQLLQLGVLHLSLAVFVMQLAIDANLAAEPRLHPAVAWALGLYAVLLLAWLIRFFVHFRRP